MVDTPASVAMISLNKRGDAAFKKKIFLNKPLKEIEIVFHCRYY